MEHHSSRMVGSRITQRRWISGGGRRATLYFLRSTQEPHLHVAMAAQHCRDTVSFILYI